MARFKKILTTILTVAISMTFFMMSVLADSNDFVYMDDGDTAYIYDGIFDVLSIKRGELSGNGWSYDGRWNKLTLNGFNGSMLNFRYFTSTREFTIELEDGSVNYITYPNEQKNFYYYDGNEYYVDNKRDSSINRSDLPLFSITKNVTIKGGGQLIIDCTNTSGVYAFQLLEGESPKIDSNLVISGGTSVGAAEELKLGKKTRKKEQLNYEYTNWYLETNEGTPATYVRICPSDSLQTPPSPVPVAINLPEVPYYSFFMDPLFCYQLYRKDRSGFNIAGNISDIVDHGSYYELKNQYLYNFKLYDSEAEAMQSEVYQLNKRSKVQQHPCGKYVVFAGNKGYDKVMSYFGSLYIKKDVIVSYALPDPDNPDRGSMVDCTWEEYFALPASITNNYNGAIEGYVSSIDEYGYITGIEMTQLD